jgi:hypothetical protein
MTTLTVRKTGTGAEEEAEDGEAGEERDDAAECAPMQAARTAASTGKTGTRGKRLIRSPALVRRVEHECHCTVTDSHLHV